jgi:hypothetical protein
MTSKTLYFFFVNSGRKDSKRTRQSLPMIAVYRWSSLMSRKDASREDANIQFAIAISSNPNRSNRQFWQIVHEYEDLES